MFENGPEAQNVEPGYRLDPPPGRSSPAYGNHFNNGFHFDDTHTIENELTAPRLARIIWNTRAGR
jgi:hypothetical protein